MKNELKHTAHSSYRCEYHVVFAPRYRRKVIYGEIKSDIGVILRKLCNEMKVEIIEAEACPDHIHMLVSIPPYMSIAQFVGTLKSKSALMIFDRHANLKYRYGSRNLQKVDRNKAGQYRRLGRLRGLRRAIAIKSPDLWMDKTVRGSSDVLSTKEMYYAAWSLGEGEDLGGEDQSKSAQ